MSTATVDPTRLAEIVRLDAGGHDGPTPAGGACLTEAAAYVAGETWSDAPACVCPVVAAYARRINDRMGDAERQRLLPYVARIVGTRADDATERCRAYICADRAVRVFAPLGLDAVGLQGAAQRLRALPPVTDKFSARDAYAAVAAHAAHAAAGAEAAVAAADFAGAEAAAWASVAYADAAYAATAAADAAYAYAATRAAAAALDAWPAALALLDDLIAA